MNSSQMSEYISSSRACGMLGVTPNTLRSWANDGKVQHIRTQGGQRRYLLSSVRSIVDPIGLVAGYILDRVGESEEERRERERPIIELSHSTTGVFTIFRDVGSPFDLINRTALRDIIKRSRNTKVTLFINEPTDLASIGYDLIVSVIEAGGGRVMVLSQKPSMEAAHLEALMSTTLLVRCPS